ncbi:MAG TPA: hypothetical protein VFQ60_05680 [Patescibacteria group bacterium]|nr:hypothetical protein [Patescibacteria group bacterium]
MGGEPEREPENPGLRVGKHIARWANWFPFEATPEQFEKYWPWHRAQILNFLKAIAGGEELPEAVREDARDLTEVLGQLERELFSEEELEGMEEQPHGNLPGTDPHENITVVFPDPDADAETRKAFGKRAEKWFKAFDPMHPPMDAEQGDGLLIGPGKPIEDIEDFTDHAEEEEMTDPGVLEQKRNEIQGQLAALKLEPEYLVREKREVLLGLRLQRINLESAENPDPEELKKIDQLIADTEQEVNVLEIAEVERDARREELHDLIEQARENGGPLAEKERAVYERELRVLGLESRGVSGKPYESFKTAVEEAKAELEDERNKLAESMKPAEPVEAPVEPTVVVEAHEVRAEATPLPPPRPPVVTPPPMPSAVGEREIKTEKVEPLPPPRPPVVTRETKIEVVEPQAQAPVRNGGKTTLRGVGPAAPRWTPPKPTDTVIEPVPVVMPVVQPSQPAPSQVQAGTGTQTGGGGAPPHSGVVARATASAGGHGWLWAILAGAVLVLVAVLIVMSVRGKKPQAVAAADLLNPESIKTMLSKANFDLKDLPNGADDIDLVDGYVYMALPEGESIFCPRQHPADTMDCFVCPKAVDALGYRNPTTHHITLQDPDHWHQTQCATATLGRTATASK